MRVLWHSQPPWMTGSFGQQTATFVPRLAAAGHEVAVSASTGLYGGVQEWRGIPVFPGDPGNDLSQAGLARSTRLFGPDVIVSIDARAFSQGRPCDVPAASYMAVENAPLPHYMRGCIDASVVVPWAVTRNGEALMREAGLEPVYVPHGIDTSAYAPHDRSDARTQLGIPQDAFLVGMVAANRPDPRKSFPEAFEAFARFRDSHDDALLLVHSWAYGGTDLWELARQLDIADSLLMPSADAIFAGLLGPEAMALEYSAMNVLLSPSRGEGFGLPLIEAQACGVPVIVTDFGAMPEVGAVGWKVGGTREYVPSIRSWWMRPSVPEMVNALGEAYDDAGRLARDARAHARMYDADLVTETYLLPALALLSPA